ncbi:acetyl-CoA C-acyltransferase [Candidatus Poribacteria bacterium]|nr:acetyl-CoA C-acyltransferase [Candidatus Poribacteria bacterium]
MSQERAYIVDAVRTPVGRLGGALAGVRPDDLAAHVIRALLRRTGVDASRVEDVVFGCANQAGEDNRNVARMASLLAGLPPEVAGVTVNRLCASSLDAVHYASRAIAVGDGACFVAGGVESMSRAPYSSPKSDAAFPRGNRVMWDTSLGWRYPNPALEAIFPLESMGETAENIHERYAITREDQDSYAHRSQMRAKAAMDAGRFDDEIEPVTVPKRRGDPTVVTRDEHPRPDSTPEKLALLRPVFRDGGSVTAGNSSGLNDGAAALLMMSAAEAVECGVRPLARVVSRAVVGVDPRCMGMGPAPATRKALSRAGLTIADIDLVELNEAFAVQALACIRDLGLDEAKVNVNGGAIALGHPVGCSGARILTTLAHEMARRESVRYGLAAMCVGVGQGAALIVERVGDDEWEALLAAGNTTEQVG